MNSERLESLFKRLVNVVQLVKVPRPARKGKFFFSSLGWDLVLGAC